MTGMTPIVAITPNSPAATSLMYASMAESCACEASQGTAGAIDSGALHRRTLIVGLCMAAYEFAMLRLKHVDSSETKLEQWS
jgi:hypothetical protein